MSSPKQKRAVSSRSATSHAQVARLYIYVFLYIEPVTAVLGAYYANFQPSTYLHLTDANSAPAGGSVPTGTLVALQQLANLYLLFALNEALTLRAALQGDCVVDLRVWRPVLACLLIADFGHLASVRQLGTDVYWKAWEWNEMDFGNVGIVYAGAALRMAFLAGVGVKGGV